MEPRLVPTGAGLVRVWMGSKTGPSRLPLAITQNTPTIPGNDDPGDEFGAVVEAGHVDTDGYDDLIVSAPRENAGAGRFTIIRGGRDGHARSGHAASTRTHRTCPEAPRRTGSSGPPCRCCAWPPTAGRTWCSRPAAWARPTSG